MSDHILQAFTGKFCFPFGNQGIHFRLWIFMVSSFQTYYNHHILALLQTLVTSGTSPALEEQLLEMDSRLSRSPDDMVQNASQLRCKLALLPLSERLLMGVMVSCITERCCTDLAFIPAASTLGYRLVVITWSLVSFSWSSLCSLSHILRRPKISDSLILYYIFKLNWAELSTLIPLR